MGQQELVIKAIDSNYTETELVAGASIRGDGRVILILDVPAIFRKAIEDEKTKITLLHPLPSREGQSPPLWEG